MTQEKITIKTIKNQIAQLPKKKMNAHEQAFIQKYLGSTKKYLGAKTNDLVKIAKKIVKEQDELQTKELIKLLDQLFAADNFEEHVVAGKILVFLKSEIRAKIPFSQIEKWLAKARGWAEIDLIRQSTYTGKEVLARWPEWEKTIKNFRQSPAISLRRASLVLQTKPVREVGDRKLRQLALETIEKLKHEKDILITKAISWLLRSLTIKNKLEVKKYIEQNKETLPKIAIRETLRVIETGKKNINNKNKE